jgi:hypothetical protein
MASGIARASEHESESIMRSELTEVERTHRMRAARQSRRDVAAALPASAVDAALADDVLECESHSSDVAGAEVVLSDGGARRHVPRRSGGELRRAIDAAHPAGSGGDAADDSLRRQLSRQLDLLEIQQRQIRRLLEQSERRAHAAQDAR